MASAEFFFCKDFLERILPVSPQDLLLRTCSHRNLLVRSLSGSPPFFHKDLRKILQGPLTGCQQDLLIHLIHLSAPHFLIWHTQASAVSSRVRFRDQFFFIFTSLLGRCLKILFSWLQFLERTITFLLFSRIATEVVTWGHVHYGADDHRTVLSDQGSSTPGQVVAIQANLSAFAAILDNGTVVAWGNPKAGGDYSSWGFNLFLVEFSSIFRIFIVLFRLCSHGIPSCFVFRFVLILPSWGLDCLV